MRYLLVLALLSLSGCATCDIEETHKFLKRNNDMLKEVCYVIDSPDDLMGEYCLYMKNSSHIR